jgi:outer membrane protein assembly factor BamA
MQGLFDDIEMRRDGDTLIVAVHERPSIESFQIEGNKDIKTEELLESLRGVGLAKGRTFDRSILENVQMALREQYYSRGKYGVVVDAFVLDRPNNTVQVGFNISTSRKEIAPRFGRSISSATLHSLIMTYARVSSLIRRTGYPGFDRTIVIPPRRSRVISKPYVPITWTVATRIFVSIPHR